MIINYHHYKDTDKEIKDKKSNWWTCPPELFCTKDEEKKLEKLWHFFNGKNAYIIDPLGHNQCNYRMLMELPYLIRKPILFFAHKVHLYDVKDE